MRRRLLSVLSWQLDRRSHASYGAIQRAVGTLDDLHFPESHGPLARLHRFSSSRSSSTWNRCSDGCASFTPPSLSGIMVRRHPLFIFHDLRRRGIEVLAISYKRMHLGGRRLLSLQRSFWGSMLPTPDTIVLSLIGANVAVFFLWRFINPSFMNKHFTVSLDNFRNGRLHTLITGAFSHSELDHLAANMIGLYFFGTNIGRLFGPEFVLKLYLAGAISGSVFFLVHKALNIRSLEGMDRWVGSSAFGLGASAAVNAIILLDVFLFPKNIYYVNLVIPVPAVLMGFLIIGHDLWRIKKGDQNISGAAHLGGAVVAALFWAKIKKGWF